jgi:transcriptional regulator with XRE-family HTH domain
MVDLQEAPNTTMVKIPARAGSELWQRLRAARKAARRTQEELGKWVGVTRAAVSQWEHPDAGKRTRPRWETLAEVAKVTGAPIDWLHDDTITLEDYWFADESEAASPPSGGKVVALFGQALMVRDQAAEYEALKDYVPILRAGPQPHWMQGQAVDDRSSIAIRAGSPYLNGVNPTDLRIVSVFDDSLQKYGYPSGTSFMVDTNAQDLSGSGFYFIEPAAVMRFVELTLDGRYCVQPEGQVVDDSIRIAGKAIIALKRIG